MISTLLIIILFFLSPTFSHGAMSVHAAVVINEVYPKPEDGVSEWIELYNTGSDDVSLDRWKLSNTNGDKKEYIFNASFIIAHNGFLTLNRSQTNITLFDNGDTVNLYNVDGTKVDSQGYASTIGTNRSVGRAPDGTGVWSEDCTYATKNAANVCIAPTPTTTPLPTSVPPPPPPPPVTTPPAETMPPLPPEVQNSVEAKTPAVVLGVIHTPTPTPLPPDVVKVDIPSSFIISKTTIAQILIIAVCWIILAIGATIQRKFGRRKRKTPVPPTSPPSV